jgi:magnesium chelatase family protein
VVRARVEAARARQLVRGGCANAELSGRALDEACTLEAAGRRLLQLISAKRGLSARAIHRVLRVARTAADLEGRERLTAADIALAFELRSLDEARP